jgi:AcrR family transcriptional regulator
MGNREALMEAAKRCLAERGYSHTSARDVATEAGVSTAAIGYHYGTKDALLMQALLEALAEWGAALGQKMLGPSAPGTSAGERFTQNWERVIETFTTDRELWRIQFDMLGAMDRNPRLKEFLSGSNRDARLALVAMFGDPRGADAPADDEAERLGSFYQALLAGLSAQYLLNPATALSARDLARVLTSVAAMLERA